MRLWCTLALLLTVGCGNRTDLDSDEAAEIAYRGLDQAVERAMRLGLKGFSEATSANIDPQHDEGEISGTMRVTGQADQGASANKELRLNVELEDYADYLYLEDGDEAELEIVYETRGDGADLDLSLRNIPTGTVSGTFKGTFLMIGDLEGEITLDLSIDGHLEPDPDIDEGVRRVSGSTTVTGTAINEHDGEYRVDVEI